MAVDINLKDEEWTGVSRIRVPLEGGGTQVFSLGGGSTSLQTKTVTYTPSSSQQTDTVRPDESYDGMSQVNVTVNAVSAGTEGTPTATKGTVSNHSVTVTPSVTNTGGYIDGGTHTGTGVSVSASELVSGSQTVAGNGTFDVTDLAQLIVDTPEMNLPSAPTARPSGTFKAIIPVSTSTRYLNIPTGLNDTAQYYNLSPVGLAPLNVTANGTYNASTYDITGFNTVTVNVPTGGATLQTKTATYTPTTSQQTDSILPDTGYDGMSEVDITINAVATGSEGTPTATKGTVTNHSVTVTPSVTNTAGYISGGTHTGNAVTVTANELVSGTLNVTSSGTEDVTNYASVSIPSGTVVPPASITEIGTVTVVTPTDHGSPRMRVTATSQAVPNVTQAGYISAGTSGQISVTLDTSVTGKGTATFYPSTSDQTINASTYVSGVQTFKAVEYSSNLIASNIKSGQTITIGDADDPDRILSVTGTYTGGSSKFVTGTFLTTTNQSANMTVTVPYSGSGYPVLLVIEVEGGAYDSTNTDWYNSMQRYSVGLMTIAKSTHSSTPTYTTSGSANYGTVELIYKNSTSSSTTYSRTSSMTANSYSSSNANGTSTTCVRWKDSTTISYRTGGGSSSSYGLLGGIWYRYYAIYSS